ncbi:hypothetical protein [Rhizohabitans arisaemae]|uniref:hypothetical protein n=1 Tax=Rhizohabitans arisaemae TaxID=2720610 RepID=UPI0024B2822D|nr:hypothetical protein [Rhizohabitans arisaemae]
MVPGNADSGPGRIPVARASEAEPGMPAGSADLRVRISATPHRAQPGQLITYQVRVHNAGPGAAVLPVLVVRIPPQVDIVRTDVAECRPGDRPGEVLCPSTSDAEAGHDGGVQIIGLVRAGARGTLHAAAGLDSQIVDANPGDNHAELRTAVDPGADLRVQLSAEGRHVHAGRRFTVDAVVVNRGPQPVRNGFVMLQPKGARFVGSADKACRARGRHVGCGLRRVAADGKVRLSLVFRTAARRDGRFAGNAMVFSPRIGDRRPDNNTDRLSLRIRRPEPQVPAPPPVIGATVSRPVLAGAVAVTLGPGMSLLVYP